MYLFVYLAVARVLIFFWNKAPVVISGGSTMVCGSAFVLLTFNISISNFSGITLNLFSVDFGVSRFRKCILDVPKDVAIWIIGSVSDRINLVSDRLPVIF